MGQWAIDHSGENHHGWLLGNFARSYPQGKIHAGQYFDGKSTLCLGDKPAFNVTDQLLIDLWVYPTDLSYKTRNLVAKISEAKGFSYRLYLRGSQPIFHLYADSGEGELASAIDLKKDVWSHLVAHYDGEKMILLINEHEVAEKPYGYNLRSTHAWLEIGSSTYRNENFVGMIDEVIIAGR